MATFANMKTEVLTLVIDTPTAVQTLVGSFVNRAHRKLQVKHNFKVMESEVSFTTNTAQADTRVLGARPSDWKMPRGNPYYIESLGGFMELSYAPSKGEALARYGNDPDLDYGSPRVIVEDDLPQEFDVYPFPDGLSDYSDGEYRITIPYWKFLSPLVSDNDEDWLTTNAEQYIIYQAVAEAFYANEDEQRAQIWERRAKPEFDDVVKQDKYRRLGEVQSLVPHLGARMPHLGSN